MKLFEKLDLLLRTQPCSFVSANQQHLTQHAMYTFTPTASYSLSGHTITFSKSGIVVKNSGGTVVDQRTYGSAFNIAVVGTDFCFGTLTLDANIFVKRMHWDRPKTAASFDNATTMFIWQDDPDSPGIATHTYNISQCPLRFTAPAKNKVDITCPCNNLNSPCGNSCYAAS